MSSTEYFISSDHHFNHANILKYSAEQRQCNNLDEMHEALIERHNSVVGKNDVSYFLGDFSFSKKPDVVLSHFARLNGKIRFIVGNHDHWVAKVDFNEIKNLEWIKQYYEVKPYNDLPHLVLFHFPIQSWHRKNYGAIHCFGHCHGNLKTPEQRRMDVGIDCNNMYPFNLRETMEKLNQNPVSEKFEKIS
jgi:calcineurin-like phosphoesterase family protein